MFLMVEVWLFVDCNDRGCNKKYTRPGDDRNNNEETPQQYIKEFAIIIAGLLL